MKQLHHVALLLTGLALVGLSVVPAAHATNPGPATMDFVSCSNGAATSAWGQPSTDASRLLDCPLTYTLTIFVWLQDCVDPSGGSRTATQLVGRLLPPHVFIPQNIYIPPHMSELDDIVAPSTIGVGGDDCI